MRRHRRSSDDQVKESRNLQLTDATRKTETCSKRGKNSIKGLSLNCKSFFKSLFDALSRCFVTLRNKSFLFNFLFIFEYILHPDHYSSFGTAYPLYVTKGALHTLFEDEHARVFGEHLITEDGKFRIGYYIYSFMRTVFQ